VLTNVKPTMTVACEEVFGPVLAVIGFDTEDEAIALANDSRYGLGRENGIDAVHEYTQTKAIWVELTGGTRDPFTLG
jgi:(Z)-2-((N-methylformamido)methylene)-5-hydroxybutyrolactone dehydrogenase